MLRTINNIVDNLNITQSTVEKDKIISILTKVKTKYRSTVCGDLQKYWKIKQSFLEIAMNRNLILHFLKKENHCQGLSFS